MKKIILILVITTLTSHSVLASEKARKLAAASSGEADGTYSLIDKDGKASSKPTLDSHCKIRAVHLGRDNKGTVMAACDNFEGTFALRYVGDAYVNILAFSQRLNQKDLDFRLIGNDGNIFEASFYPTK
jgi:hypothetical protein